jgi:hypothetical protein
MEKSSRSIRQSLPRTLGKPCPVSDLLVNILAPRKMARDS